MYVQGLVLHENISGVSDLEGHKIVSLSSLSHPHTPAL